MAADFKYLDIYNRYKNLILNGKMKSGARLPSIRACAEENSVSRTTVQTAYDCLAADGCIIAKPQSGYFAADIALQKTVRTPHKSTSYSKPKFDLASERADSESFDFALWQQYIKSALRNSERLTTYGEPQGEYDLRCAVCDYLQKSRSAVCSPESIVIGAGSQSLLSLVLPLIRDRRTVHFTNSGFSQGKTVFTDNGFTLCDN
ncbi:MAG: GntR family transcriptional regulator, partial [Acutalibacteraceae bacterium]|nr:GntR family transcriptional regulator [Acutalibacteraceae bacterium]